MYQPPHYQPTPASNKAAQDIKQTFLNKQVLIKISDGRYFQGIFACVDHECNIILQGAHEYQDSSGRGKRWFGMVMVPGKHLVEINVKAAWTNAIEASTSSMYI